MRTAVYFDYDGTLAEWKLDGDITEPDYFYNLMPQENYLRAAKELLRTPEIEVYGLSCIMDEDAEEQKRQWTEDFFPELPPSHEIYVPNEDRGKKFSYIPTAHDPDCINILIDDHTDNLVQFERAGGFGVKAMNPINGKNGTWKGQCVFWDDPDIAGKILAFSKGILAEKEKEVERERNLELEESWVR